jgi:hypothetical protein
MKKYKNTVNTSTRTVAYVQVFLLFVHVSLSLLTYTLDAATLTEAFPCFFLSCKANARVKLAKTGHGPYSPLLCCSYCCVVLCID